MIRYNLPYPRTVGIIIMMITGIFFLVYCDDHQPKSLAHDKTKIYSGGESCASCHKKIYEQHILTNHFLTSVAASEKFIKGSFEDGKNIFAFNATMAVMMEKQDTNFYQVAYLNGIEKIRRRFDIIVGSGNKGQTYLFWSSKKLFQLPITYFAAAKQWSNSPGFPGKIIFNRPITSRCLECHSTFIQTMDSAGKQLDVFNPQQKILYGIDCEKCHGPGAQHVLFHQQNKTDTIARFIVNPVRLNTQQQIDLCALCHAGRLQKTKPSFSFQAGDVLKDFFLLDTTEHPAAGIDVHGNQLGLLAASECFRKSKTMTCSTCHDAHNEERGNKALFSARCLSCHGTGVQQHCTVKNISPSILEKNCIDCHMPEQASRSIAVFLQGNSDPTPANMRTHWIKIYPPTETVQKALNTHLRPQQQTEH